MYNFKADLARHRDELVTFNDTYTMLAHAVQGQEGWGEEDIKGFFQQAKSLLKTLYRCKSLLEDFAWHDLDASNELELAQALIDNVQELKKVLEVRWTDERKVSWADAAENKSEGTDEDEEAVVSAPLSGVGHLSEQLAKLHRRMHKLKGLADGMLSKNGDDFDAEKVIGLAQSAVRLGMEALMLSQKWSSESLSAKEDCVSIRKDAVEVSIAAMTYFEDTVCAPKEDNVFNIRFKALREKADKALNDADRVRTLAEQQFSARKAVGLLESIRAIAASLDELSSAVAASKAEVEKRLIPIMCLDLKTKLITKGAALRTRIIDSI